MKDTSIRCWFLRTALTACALGATTFSFAAEPSAENDEFLKELQELPSQAATKTAGKVFIEALQADFDLALVGYHGSRRPGKRGQLKLARFLTRKQLARQCANLRASRTRVLATQKKQPQQNWVGESA